VRERKSDSLRRRVEDVEKRKMKNYYILSSFDNIYNAIKAKKRICYSDRRNSDIHMKKRHSS